MYMDYFLEITTGELLLYLEKFNDIGIIIF